MDSTFYEIVSDDDALLNEISSTYKDIRMGEDLAMLWGVDQGDE